MNCTVEDHLAAAENSNKNVKQYGSHHPHHHHHRCLVSYCVGVSSPCIMFCRSPSRLLFFEGVVNTCSMPTLGLHAVLSDCATNSQHGHLKIQPVRISADHCVTIAVLTHYQYFIVPPRLNHRGCGSVSAAVQTVNEAALSTSFPARNPSTVIISE